MRKLAGVILAIGLVATTAASGSAFADRFWTGNNSDAWEDPGNWGGSEPTAADNAFIVFSATPVLVTQSGEEANLLSIANSPGTTAGLRVSGSGELTVALLGVAPEPGATGTVEVTAGGQMTVNGFVTLGSDATANATLTIDDGGTFSAANIVMGTSGATAALNVGTGGAPGTLNSDVEGAGGVTSAVTFDHGPQDLTYAGNLTGQLSLSKAGTGALTLSGTNDHTGPTNVLAGTLIVTGSLTNSAIAVQNGASLMGTGTLGEITTEGSIAPGLSPGILSTGSFAFGATGSLIVEIDGTTPGTGYDVLDVTGSVDVSDATLTLDLGFTPSAGDTFVIVDNDLADAVTGTFTGAPEGSTIVQDGTSFVISYVGGDGNDISLTVPAAVPVLPSWVLVVLAGLATGIAVWRVRP